MHINKYHSYNTKTLPKGCQYCVKGEKLVLFVTGICPRRCYFCPISDKKYGLDVIYANERKATSVKDIIDEAKNMDAKGAGITGGDPLSRLDRTCKYIDTLKKKFGKNFHIHLYTSLNLVNENNLRKLDDAGLDEIRFHPEIDSQRFWKNIDAARKFTWDVGVEIPLVPTKLKETMKLIDYVHDKIDFMNLNELEIADNSMSKLENMGFKTKNEISYAVKDSIKIGLKLIEYAKKKKYNIPMHLCTAKLKDSVQLGNRIKREGKNVKKKFDIIDDEGLLTHGVLYLPDLAPGFGYKKKLDEIHKKHFVDILRRKIDLIKKKLKFSNEQIYLDEQKPRILLSVNNVKKFKNEFKKIGLLPAIVSEYPTADSLEIEVELI